jgi:hypothetical protein
VLVGVFALAPVQAQARLLHKYLSPQIDQGAEVRAMTADAGHLWVAANQAATTEFNASTGVPELHLEDASGGGVAVGQGTGETQVYVSYRTGEVIVYSGSGVALGHWTGADTTSGPFGEGGIGGVAVDNNPNTLADPAAGRVYVSDFLQHVVDVFTPGAGGKEEFVTQIAEAEPGQQFNPGQVTVDEANGDLFVTDSNEVHNFVDVFEPTVVAGYKFVNRISGTPRGPFSHSGSLSVVADSGEGNPGEEGDVYTAEEAVGSPPVSEFAVTGAYLGAITGVEVPGGSFGGEGSFMTAVAFDPASHRLFAYDQHNNTNEEGPSAIDAFGPAVVLPDVTTGAVSGTTVEGGLLSVTLNGTVNPLGEGEASCQFAWGTSTTFGHETRCTAAVAEGSTAEPVQSKRLEGLEPDTAYFYRLQATNKNGTNDGEEEDRELTPPHQFVTPGPGLHSEWASEAASSSVTLNAMIDPHGADTSYYFQYGGEDCATAAHTCAQAPAPPGTPLGSSEGDVPARWHLQGLAAGATYHYRVVALGTLEFSPGKPETDTFYGPDRTFTTQPAGGALTLPDGRAWELVSPAQKHGALILALDRGAATTGAELQASVNGDALTYGTASPTEPEGVQGYAIENQALSRRGADGWHTQDLGTLKNGPQSSSETRPDYPLFSPDLSLALVEQQGVDSALLSDEASERTPYLRRQLLCEAQASEKECYLPLVTGKEPFADVPLGTQFGGPAGAKKGDLGFVGASADLRYVIVRSDVALTETGPTGSEAIYEWSADKPPAERLQLVSVGTSGQPVPEVERIGSDTNQVPESDGRHAISEDGSRIFWPGQGRLYMRDTVKGETIQLRGNHEGGEEATFQVATGDGSKVFFTENKELYECEIVVEAGKLACNLADLTPQSGAERVAVQEDILGASEDGSFVYFVANGVLAPGAVPGTCEGKVQGRTCDLYVYHDGQTRFIGTLSSADESDWGEDEPFSSGHELGALTAAVSSSGRYLTFISQRSLTGYDNHDANNGAPDNEVFLYDAQADAGLGLLRCISCNPSGARPVGSSAIPGWTINGSFSREALYQSRFLSGNGRLFFNSGDALVSQDINGTGDVYEYEPPGVGSCTTSSMSFNERSGGCVNLISSGTPPGESSFMDASATGGDVFFLTAERLVPQDTDTAFDVYDAHECTASSPCLSPPASAPPCTTSDSCRAAPQAQPPVFGPGASATFSGPGNPLSPAPAAVRPLTNAQKLALKSCRKKHNKHRRKVCEAEAHKRYRSGRKARRAAIHRREGR